MVAVEAPRSRLSYSAIAAYAERVARENEATDPSGRVDVYALVEKLGGGIEIDDRDESLEVHRAHDFTVYLPTHTSRLRDRFTIAHELGHYFLHYRAPKESRIGEPVEKFTRLGRNVAETQANVFASNLLMPEGQFRDAFEELDGNLVLIAERFDVSQPAAKVRANYLSLIH